MATNRLHRKSRLAACTAAQAARHCRERAELDELRLELNRESESLAKKIAAIDDDLMRFVEANRTGAGAAVDVARHRLEIVDAPGFFSYKDALVAEIGIEALEERRRQVPPKPKLQITEKVPARRSARKAA